MKVFAKYTQLKYLNLGNTSFDLDAFTITADDIPPSESTINYLNLSENKMKTGIILAKLKIFPDLEILHLDNNTLTTLDLGVIGRSELPKIDITFLDYNNFDENWLEQAARNVSMRVDRFSALVRLRKTI